MRDSIYVFLRNGEPVAELHLELTQLDEVKSSRWQGDPAVQQVITPLPKGELQSLYDWSWAILFAADREGLEFERRYEGEPFETPEDLIIRDTTLSTFWSDILTRKARFSRLQLAW